MKKLIKSHLLNDILLTFGIYFTIYAFFGKDGADDLFFFGLI